MKRTEQYSERLSRLYPELHEPVGTEKILTQTVTFQVTDDCNLACKYCYQTHKGKKKMSFDTAKKMIDLTKSFNGGFCFVADCKLLRLVQNILCSH